VARRLKEKAAKISAKEMSSSVTLRRIGEEKES
jgi:hypothetical protein